MEGAEAFLDRVLLDNTIQYRDDKNSWSFGYYINNARFRLRKAAKELRADERTDALEHELDKLKTGLNSADVSAREAYENAYAVQHALTNALAARVVK